MLNKNLFLSVLAMMVSCAVIGLSQNQTQQKDDPMDTVKSFITALCNADLDGVLASFADDATVFMPLPSFPKRLAGRTQIREGFAPLFDSLRNSGKEPPYMILVPKDVEVQRFERTAIVSFHLGLIPSGKSEKHSNFSRRTLVLRYSGSKWLIVHFHGSNMLVGDQTKKKPD